ncbi:hypothetical protein ACA910_012804 [Epithemia clementina (nom. ined.)]
MSPHPKRAAPSCSTENVDGGRQVEDEDENTSKRVRHSIDEENKDGAIEDAAPNLDESAEESQRFASLKEDDDNDDDDEQEEEDDPETSDQAVHAGSAKTPTPSDPAVPPSYETIRHNPTDPVFFHEYLFALISFKVDHGNYSVHKDACPNLYAWLGHMKREYARFTHQPTTANMTAEQKKILEYLHVPLTHRGDDHWNRFYNMLESYKKRHGHVLVPRVCEVPGLGDWVTDQRRQYKSWKLGKATQLTKDRRERLEKLGFTWQVRYRPEWDQRYAELLEYKKKFGDCKVPQHYRENRALGKWVAKQREQFKLKKKGQHSFLTPDREEKLNSVGFMWQVRSNLAEDEEDEQQPGHQTGAQTFATAAPTTPPGMSSPTTRTGTNNAAIDSEKSPEELSGHQPTTNPLDIRDVGQVTNL